MKRPSKRGGDLLVMVQFALVLLSVLFVAATLAWGLVVLVRHVLEAVFG